MVPRRQGDSNYVFIHSFRFFCLILPPLLVSARNLTSLQLQLSSAHVYLRMTAGMTWETIPQALLADCAQLVKANSIEGGQVFRVCFNAMSTASRKQEK